MKELIKLLLFLCVVAVAIILLPYIIVIVVFVGIIKCIEYLIDTPNRERRIKEDIEQEKKEAFNRDKKREQINYLLSVIDNEAILPTEKMKIAYKAFDSNRSLFRSFSAYKDEAGVIEAASFELESDQIIREWTYKNGEIFQYTTIIPKF